ncbi:Vacuolar aminopeptidase 1 [Venturia nashicola]|nr:Vacuolar aminopeptidase 1 [Venturia nashicola]
MVFYEPGKTPHSLPHDPFKACVIPRPIGWISTTSPSGKHNLAPYSQFNNLTFDPPYVMFSANQTSQNARKDTTMNAELTGKFCWNLATYRLRDHVNISAEQTPYGIDEFEKAGLDKCFSTVLKGDEVEGMACPMVKASPVRFECEYHSTIRLPGNPPMGTVDIVIGRVIGVHIDEDVLTDGKLDVRKTEPIARCGYYEYTVVRETFEMVIPGMDEANLAGLEGSTKRHAAVASSTETTESGPQTVEK